MAVVSLLSDADLHGLVDGHIDADRRADVLRRAAASPRDRALIEAWKDQNDLIRAAFAVAFEPLPRALDLRTPPQLHAVPLAAIVAPAVPKPPRWRHLAGTAVTIAAIGAGLAGSWYIASQSTEEARLPPARAASPVEDRMLADRTIAALAFGDAEMPVAAAVAEPPPTAAIPDLSGAGFTFTGAEARGISPKSVIFRYRNADGERVAVGAIRASGDDTEPVRHDGGYTWRNRRVAYAVFGTMASDRLAALAQTLHADGRPE